MRINYLFFSLLCGSLAAVSSVCAQQTQIQYLSGTDKDHTVPWQFFMTGGGRSNNVSTTIPVPSSWQTKGFGAYSYQASPSSVSVGQYSTTFSVPSNWSGKRIFLVYEGVLTDTVTMINGQVIAGAITNSTVSAGTSNAIPNDRAFDNSSATAGGSGGLAVNIAGNTLNLGSLNKFTMTGWIKPASDFASLPGGIFPRLMMVGPTAGYDMGTTNGVGVLVYNSGTLGALQVKINADTGNGVITSGGVLTGADWVFVAVTYDATLANNNVNIYVGNKTGTLGTPVTTATYAKGPVNFGSTAFAYLLNRTARDRAMAGWGDDFRFFTNVLDQITLDSVRATAVSTSAPPVTATASYQWNFDTATTGTTVMPVLGASGILNFTNSAGAAANLYSATGQGISGTNGSTTNLTVTSTAHQGGFYEFSYEVTTNVVAGASTNVLNVTVNEWSANTSINSAERSGDYWNFSGIFRPVYLMAKPQSNIERLAVDAQAGGQINASVFLSGIASNCLLIATVTDSNNVALGSPFTNTVSAGATNVLLSATLPAPQPWSAEFPNLYTLTVQLRDTNSVLIHTVTNVIGFRTIIFSNNTGFFVNGKKVLLRGICRHEFWPNDGRTSSRAESDLDIQLIKDMNFDAVRLTHYPPNKVFLEECDRLGLYVLDELAGWQHAYDNTVAPDLVRQMVIRDVNHPCIIAWDNANEGGWNTTVDATFALWDPQNRKVMHPGGNVANLVDNHYPSYTTFAGDLGAGLTAYLPTEILHGLYDGGAGASLSDYWDLMRTAPNGAGMFLWAFLDEGVVRDDLGDVIDVHGQNAPDGLVGPYRQPEASYYAYKALYNPAQVTSPNPATFNGTLAVENRYEFTSLNQCKFDWQLGWFLDAADPASPSGTSTNALTGGLLVALDSGSFAGPAVLPGATGPLPLPGFPANGTNYDALRLTATDPFGNNLYTWTWPLHTPAQIRDRILGAVSVSAPVISAGTNTTEIVVTNGPRVFHFSKITGMINSLTVSNQAVSFTNGPALVAGSWAVTAITNYSDGTNYIVLVNDLTNAANGFQWTLRPDGWLKLSYRYTLTGPQNFMGITFDYPSNQVTAMNWLGSGPYRVYKNRLAGQEIFVHTKTYNDVWTGQSTNYSASAPNGSTPTKTQWVYPEFAGYHGQLNWAALQTTELPITIVSPTTNLFLRVLTPPATDNNNVNPVYPSGGISLLHGIAPQGEKFHAAASYGPSAAVNTTTGLYTGEASFFFGALPVSSTDRDGNGLNDSWELKYFGALAQNPLSRSNPDGLPLMVENAFDLSPANNNLNSPRLPHFAKGATAPVALVYIVPASQAGFFNYTPQISADLQTWIGTGQHPEYFSITTGPNGSDTLFTVQPVPAAWPGDSSHLFLRLQIKPKP
jgi:Glycosyl hydrolases family 2, TIM barrel domain/Glycosyl hydrolases family 2/Glycosyl hydrolases family 2, sugar binding domain